MNRFHCILCVVDSHAASSPALERSIALAAANQAKLSVIGVVPQLVAGTLVPGRTARDKLRKR